MTVDTTYCFFSSPDFEEIPSIPKAKHYLKKDSNRISQPELVSYQKTSSTAAEEWCVDTSYGYFTCPTMNLEPVVRREQAREAPKRSITPTKVLENADGYSFFGV